MNKFNKFMTGYDKGFEVNLKDLFTNSVKPIVTVDETGKVNKKTKLWLRVFLLLLSLCFVYIFIVYLNDVALAFPWLALIASAIVPITVATFIYEIPGKESVSIMNIILVFLIGTAGAFFALVQMFVSYGYEEINIIIIAPIIEEIAKAIVVISTIQLLKIKSVKSAILIGWVVGAGFQIAESLGYATYYGYEGIFTQIEFVDETTYYFVGFIDYSTLILRSIFSFGSHALYAALGGAAYMLSAAKINNRKHFNYLRFIIWFMIPILLHALNNLFSVFVTNAFALYSVLISLEIVTVFIFYYLLNVITLDEKYYVDETLLIQSELPNEPTNETPVQ